MKRIAALETENEVMRRASNLKGKTSKMLLKRIKKSEDEKRNLELKLKWMGAREKTKVAKIQALQKEKEERKMRLREGIKKKNDFF